MRWLDQIQQSESIMRYTLLAAALLVVPSLQAQSAPVSVAVQSWHLDPATNQVTLEIVNRSHKDVTGYTIRIQDTFADGHVDWHELTAEYVGLERFMQEMKGSPNEALRRERYGDGLFHPGEVREEFTNMQPGSMGFHADVVVAAYADGTVEATNKDALRRLADHRKAALESMQLANDIIQTALGDPNDANPAATAASKIQDRINAWKAQRHTTEEMEHFESDTLKGIVDELRQISSRDALARYLQKSERDVVALSPHADLKETGVQ